MRKLILITCLLWTTGVLLAQYQGGVGDGSATRRALQLDLEGIPSGVRPLYAGGVGDGYFTGSAFASLSGSPAADLYNGGIGDGYARQAANATLSGTNLAFLFGGGQGDGYARLAGSFSPDGQSLAVVFGGGAGDGYADNRTAATLGGQLLAQIYGGGAGDGYAHLSGSALLGMAMTMLYGGGAGDGFDHQAAYYTLGGTNLATLFRGGGGDGSDYASFFGVLPLPLTLISFDAFPEETYVLLRWVTEDEVATDFFTIEKTRDGRAYDWVGEEPAAGYSLPGEQLHYELKDLDPYLGTSYYRLKTTDFDGAISLSQLVEVHYVKDQNWGFQLFPNPNTGQHFTLNLEGIPAGEKLLLEVVDASGRIIYRQELAADATARARFDLQDRLPAGSYLVRLVHPVWGASVKILLVAR